MKVLLDIRDDKAAFIMELLKNFRFVKTKPLTTEKDELVKDIKEAVEYVNQVKAGKVKPRPVQDLLDEL